MPTFIPDRLKTPGDFPSVDANDNQIRGFGYFANNAARTALAEEFRCQGYLAFMKDSNQFKQYGSADLSGWSTPGNWTLLEGTSTDTFWAADSDGTGIYRNGQVIVGATTISTSDNLHVVGGATVTGSLKANIKLETPLIHSASGLNIVIDTDGTESDAENFQVKYIEEGGTGERVAINASPYTSTRSVSFGNIEDEFKFDFFSTSYSNFRALSAAPETEGFKFSDYLGTDGEMLFRIKEDDTYLELSDGGRKITTAPHTYKLFSNVEDTSDVTHGVEMLMPSSVTGDWEFNHLGNKNFVFKTSTSGTAKLQAKFHSAYNGVVSIGSANHYVEYNGLQPATTLADRQPKLFIVNDAASTIGIRVQSGDTSAASGDFRLQPVLFTEVRDDGFYISRDTTGPRYNTSTPAFESGIPSAAIGMKRHGSSPGGRGNSLELFARNNLYFTSNSTPSFSVVGDPNADVRKLQLHSPDGNKRLDINIKNSDNDNGSVSFSHNSTGTFLKMRGNENILEIAGQRLHSTQRGAEFSTFQGGADTQNPLVVRTFNSKHVGENGTVYPTLAALEADGTTEDSNVIPTDTTLGASSVSLSVDGREGHVFVSQRLGVGVTAADTSYRIRTNGRILAKTQNAYDNVGQWAYNIEVHGSQTIVGGLGLRAAADILIGGFNNNAVTIAKHVPDGDMDDEILGRFTETGLGLGIESPTSKLHVVGQTHAQGVLKSSFGLQNNGDTVDMSILNNTPGTGYIRLINTNGSNQQKEGLRVLNDGKVGIGKPSPTSKLHILGSVTGNEGNEGKLRVYGAVPLQEDSTDDVYGSATWSPGGSIEIGRIVNGSVVTPGITLNGHSLSGGVSSGTAARANIYKHGTILDIGFSGGSGSKIAPVFNEQYSLGSPSRKWLEVYYTSSYSSWITSGLSSSSNSLGLTYNSRRGHGNFYPTNVDVGTRTTGIVANGGLTINPKFVYRDAYTSNNTAPASTSHGGLGRNIQQDVTKINGSAFSSQTTGIDNASNYDTGVYTQNPTKYVLSFSANDFTTDSADGAVDYISVVVSSNGSISRIQPCDSNGNNTNASIGSGFRIGDIISFPAGFAGTGSQSIEVTLKPFTGLRHDSLSASDPGLGISDGGAYTHKFKAGGVRGVHGVFSTYGAGISTDDFLDDLQGFNGGLSLSVEEDGSLSAMPNNSFYLKARDIVMSGPRVSNNTLQTQWIIGRGGISPAGSDPKPIGLDKKSGLRWFVYGSDSGSKYILTNQDPVAKVSWSATKTFSDADKPTAVNDTSVITYGPNTYAAQNPHGSISSSSGSGSNGGVHGFQLSVGIGSYIDRYTDANGTDRAVSRRVQVVPVIKAWAGNAAGQSLPDGLGYASVVIGKDDQVTFDHHGDIICNIPGAGMVLSSSNGTKYRIKVADDGTISSEAYTIPAAYS